MTSTRGLDVPMGNVESALTYLSTAQPSKPTPASQQPPNDAFLLCAPPDNRIPPQFVVAYRRPLLLVALPGIVSDKIPSALQFACAELESGGLQSYLSLDLRFEQVWNLTELGVGDLASTIALAPSERLTLEFQSTQRRLLEQTTLDSAEELASTESTTIDKEVINIVRASSKTDNWHVDTNGSISISFAGVGASASGAVSSTTTQSAQSALEHVTESTRKSAHSLKTLHKIEVHGVSENLIQNRMTRIIENPYRDRTLSINVFQLIKHFSILTQLTEIRLALVFSNRWIRI